MQPIATLFAALVIVVGGALAYRLQKKVDRKESLIEQRRRVYTDFLLALFDHAEHRNAETRLAFDRSKVELVLVASDEVMKQLVWVQEAATMDMDALDPGDVHERALDLIAAMREDCFEQSKLSVEDLGYVTPIGKKTPLGKSPEGHYEP